ncbi:MAG TPA: PQQ-binding-like beta-propeller repeat protein [Planctomycetota bacterium]|nr:PQQ-binding-like beta-propeller repeat protein [Planctomycetota bacterium]
MKRTIMLAGLFAIVLSASVDAQVTGWRGDGSGRYPDATPPLQWGYGVSLEGFRVQAAKPKGDDPAGASLADGVIRQWLVAGPFEAPNEPTGETEIVKGEADFAPDAGEAVGAATWKAMPTDEALLDLEAFFDKKTDVAAYAHAWVYAPADTSLFASFVVGGRSVIWVNGKPVYQPKDKNVQYARVNVALPLRKGWNRLLVRTMPSLRDKTCYAFVYAYFRGDLKGKPEARNVLWCEPPVGVKGPIVVGERLMPTLGGGAAPIVVGERMFLQSEPYDLVCLDKNTGKVLWVRSNNYFEATPEAERRGPPFEEAAKLNAELKTLNDVFASPEGLTREQLLAKHDLQRKLYDAMRKIDPAKYTFTKEQDLGMAGFVPTSDGKHVWAWYASGIAACYDLDGNRRWIALDNRGAQHHGFETSPLLLDGKLIVYLGDIRALDAATGKPLWVQPICTDPKQQWWYAFHGWMHPLKIGGVAMFITPNGTIRRASDGVAVYQDRSMCGGLQRPSPVVQGNTVFKLDSGGTLHILKLPPPDTGPDDHLPQVSHVKVKLDASGHYVFGSCWTASPVYHDGLVYCLHNSGMLSVVDVEKGEVVYRRLLDLDMGPGWSLISPSVTFAGGRLYALSCTGTCVVFEPGREFKQVAKNRVAEAVGVGQWWQRPERFAASPVFDGKRLYLRGEAHLYCIGR